MPSRLLPVLVALFLAACVAQPRLEADSPAPATDLETRLHSFTIDRAYSLTDTRELAFRDQIAAAAREVCEMGEFSLYSTRPIGVEQVREDFLYRQYDVQITCDR